MKQQYCGYIKVNLTYSYAALLPPIEKYRKAKTSRQHFERRIAIVVAVSADFLRLIYQKKTVFLENPVSFVLVEYDFVELFIKLPFAE